MSHAQQKRSLALTSDCGSWESTITQARRFPDGVAYYVRSIASKRGLWIPLIDRFQITNVHCEEYVARYGLNRLMLYIEQHPDAAILFVSRANHHSLRDKEGSGTAGWCYGCYAG